MPGGAATKNQVLAGLRHFFDALDAPHAAALNPFQSVRGVKNPLGKDRTPEVSVKQARELLASMDTRHVINLRDRAVLGTFVCTGARVGAFCRLRFLDLQDHGNHRALGFSEKDGKVRQILLRHDVDEWITADVGGAGP